MRRQALSFLLALPLLLTATRAEAQSDANAGGGASPAPAGQSSPAPDDAARLEQARQLYRDGVTASHAHHYADAVIAFERSYELRPHPITLYNAAEARFRAGDRDRALEQLRQMLAMTNPAPDDQTIQHARDLAHEAGVDNLQPAESSAAPAPCPACPTCPPEHECPTCPPQRVVTAHVGMLPLGLGVAGFLLVAVGAGFYGVALGDAGAYNNPDNPNYASLNNDLRSQGSTYRWIGLGGVILGVVAEAASIYMLLHPSAPAASASRETPRRLTAHFDVGPSGAFLSGTF